MAIDVSRSSDGLIKLPAEISQEIWQNAQQASIVQTLSPRIDLPAGGIDIPVMTGDPEAQWVTETDEKPVSRPAFSSKTIRGHKMAVIVPFSNEFRRDYGALYSAVVSKLPAVLAKKFDRTALGFEPSPGTGFDTLADAPHVFIDSYYHDWVSALYDIDPEADISAWALSRKAEVLALAMGDANGRPILLQDFQNDGSVGSIMGRPVFRSQNTYNPDTKVWGVAGDWESTAWGAVEDITLRISEQATINDNGTQLNLWQRNMFAVMAEFEVGFSVRDPKRFVTLGDKLDDLGG